MHSLPLRLGLTALSNHRPLVRPHFFRASPRSPLLGRPGPATTQTALFRSHAVSEDQTIRHRSYIESYNWTASNLDAK